MQRLTDGTKLSGVIAAVYPIKIMLRKLDGRVWTEFKWLKIEVH